MGKTSLNGLLDIAFVAELRERYWDWSAARSAPLHVRREDQNDRRGALSPDPGISVAVAASLEWLCRAQDHSTSQDGGVARNFSLVTGWSESYPETTGYIVPTMIERALGPNRDIFRDRARNMLDWMVEIQSGEGAFYGGMVSQKPRALTTFNTGQILIGLAAGAREFGDQKYVEATHKAADWLRDTQDPDGCWRRFPSPFTIPGEKTYETHVSWGLFEAARLAPDAGYGEAGLKQVRWALSKQTENGWFADCCLQNPDRPLTHTIGYALRGILEAYKLSGDKAFMSAALLTGRALLDCAKPDGRLPGRLTASWNPAVKWVCLTGQVQIAYCWLMLFELTGDRSFLDGAQRGNAFVRRTVKIDGDPDVTGGIKGSFPVGSEYGRNQFLNWAAKFFIDSNCLEAQLTA